MRNKQTHNIITNIQICVSKIDKWSVRLTRKYSDFGSMTICVYILLNTTNLC